MTHSPLAKQTKTRTQLVQAAKLGQTRTVEELLQQKTLSSDRQNAFQEAVTNGHMECVKLLLPCVKPQHNKNFALRTSLKNRTTAITEILLPFFEYHPPKKMTDVTVLEQCVAAQDLKTFQQLLPFFKDHNNIACLNACLKYASLWEEKLDFFVSVFPYCQSTSTFEPQFLYCIKNGLFKMSDFLLKNISFSANVWETLFQDVVRDHSTDIETIQYLVDNIQTVPQSSLLSAVGHPNSDVLHLILKHTDPQDSQCRALKWAIKRQKKNSFDILLPISDVENNPQMLAFAVDAGMEYIKDLLPRCEVSYANSAALKRAIELKKTDMFDLLLPQSEAHYAIEKAIHSDDPYYLKTLLDHVNREDIQTPSIVEHLQNSFIELAVKPSKDNPSKEFAADLLLPYLNADNILHTLQNVHQATRDNWQDLEHRIIEQRKQTLFAAIEDESSTSAQERVTPKRKKI